MLRRVRHCNVHVPNRSLIRYRFSTSHITSQICYLTSHANSHITNQNSYLTSHINSHISSHTMCCVTSYINSYKGRKHENSSSSNNNTNANANANAICDSMSSNKSCTKRNNYNNNSSSSSNSNNNKYNTSNNLQHSSTIHTHTIQYKNGTRTAHSRRFFSTNAGANNENNATKVLLRHFLFQIHPDYFLQVRRLRI